jgi:hypothetical protein
MTGGFVTKLYLNAWDVAVGVTGALAVGVICNPRLVKACKCNEEGED